MTDVILQDLKDGLLTITMNRPERKNAMSPDFTLGLLQAAQRAADDPEVARCCSRVPAVRSASAATSAAWPIRNRKAPSFEQSATRPLRKPRQRQEPPAGLDCERHDLDPLRGRHQAEFRS